MNIRLEAPKPGRFFSTDFPLVEGSELIEMRLPLRRGRAEWSYLFPIRGEYRLTIDAVTPAGNAREIFSLRIPENREKWYLLAVFTFGLFLSGVVAGRIFTQSLPDSKRRVAASLWVLIVCRVCSTGVAAQEPGRGKYFGWLEVAPATVGKPTRVQWRLKDGDAARQTALLSLTITHLEKGKTVFSVERMPVAGEFAMNFHFTDGAEYRVTGVAALPGEETVRTEQYLSVTGVEPPVRTIIPALGFFMAAIAVGLGVGRWSRRATRS